MGWTDDMYDYKIYYDKENDYITVINVGYDSYDSYNILTDDEGNQFEFNNRNEAIDWLNDNVKPDKIDSEYVQYSKIWKSYLIRRY